MFDFFLIEVFMTLGLWELNASKRCNLRISIVAHKIVFSYWRETPEGEEIELKSGKEKTNASLICSGSTGTKIQTDHVDFARYYPNISFILRWRAVFGSVESQSLKHYITMQ